MPICPLSEFGEFDSPSILRTDGSNWLIKWSATFILAAAICFSGSHGILWVPISNPLLVGVWSFLGTDLDHPLKLKHVEADTLIKLEHVK